MYYIMCFFKQKTAYEMRISDWSSDVCSSDLPKNAFGSCAEEKDSSPLSSPARAKQAIHLFGTGIDASLEDGSDVRSEERRVGNDCVSTCRSRRLPCN